MRRHYPPRRCAVNVLNPGQVYVYVGQKSATGDPLSQAGLSDGPLYGVVVRGYVDEGETGIPSTNFELGDLANVAGIRGNTLEAESNEYPVTVFDNPSGAAWDPSNPSDLYFVTRGADPPLMLSGTASAAPGYGPSRLWRLRFSSVSEPTLGGVLEMLLDGDEGQYRLDGIALDGRGHVYLTERTGLEPHLARVLRYDVASGALTPIAEADPFYFDPNNGSPTYLGDREEISGITDASKVLGPGWFVFTLYEASTAKGQLLALFDPEAR